jgi:type I restriction enzyme S subunit
MTAWTITALQEVATIERTGVAPSDIEDGTLYVGLEHIESGGKLLDIKPVKHGDLASTKFRFTPRHVLYGKLRPYLAKIATPDFKGVCSTDILPILPGPRLDRSYLTHFLRQPSMVEYAASRSEGVNLPRLSPRVLAAFQIPLPPLGEQQRLAAILDQADALRRTRRRSIGRLNDLGRSIFYEMFGDPVENERHWQTTSLDKFGSIERGVSKHRPRNDPRLLGGPYPLIQTGDVSQANDYVVDYKSTYSEIGLRQSRIWPKGTLCITIAANIADTAILGFDSCFPDSIVGFLSENADITLFIHNWFKIVRDSIEAVAPAVAQKNINLEILKKLRVIEPPMTMIGEFATRFRRGRSNQDLHDLSLRKLNALFDSLQQRAFRGEL